MVHRATSTEPVEADDYVQFWATGDRVKGEFHCSDCGYGVTVHAQLPACPMCASTSWEQAPWSPFGRAGVFSDL
jgi:hypothetical protein